VSVSQDVVRQLLLPTCAVAEAYVTPKLTPRIVRVADDNVGAFAGVEETDGESKVKRAARVPAMPAT